MRFMPRLSSGILGKADPIELWEEITSHISDEVLLKKGVKILCVACGHGTEADVLVKRMKSLGISAEEIKESIYLIDKYQEFTNYVIQKGYTNVIRDDFLEWETDMKFDVVIGNPPYQSGNGEKGGARSLWRKFIKKAFSIINTNGYVAMVCPGFPYKANDIGNLFTNNTPIYLNNDVSGYFPGIGSEIKSWVVQQGYHNKSFVVDSKKWEWSEDTDPTINFVITSIFNKTVNSHDLFECKQDKGYNSTQFKNDNNDYFEYPTGNSVYPIRHASKVKVCYVKKPTEGHNKNKVMMTFSGYPNFEYYSKSNPISSCYQMSGYIEVNNSNQAKNLINLYNSMLYKFLSNGINSAGMKSVKSYSLPKLDLTKTWTDEELYSHFDLTQEEIDYVESHFVKSK